MDWSHENWIKLYTRNTPNWAMLSWQARTVLLHLLRSADRAGRLDIPEDYEPALSALLSLPVDILSIGISDLESAGTIRLMDGELVIEHFVEAQTARTTDRLRKRMERERKRDLSQGVTPCHTESQPVTDVPNRVEESRVEENRINPPTPLEGGLDFPLSHGKKRARKKKQPPTADEYQAKVLVLMRRALRKLRPNAKGPQVNKANLDLINRPRSECSATAEDWEIAIKAQLENVRGDDELWRYLSLSTLSVPKTFMRAIDTVPPDRRTPEEKRAEEKAIIEKEDAEWAAKQEAEDAAQPPEPSEHEQGCPRLQAWDLGEHQAPCTCGEPPEPSDV